jgi:PleD family two-component response regulator
VRQAISGPLALKAVRKSPPDLILLDILMPDMGGHEVCERLKADESTRDIPIIFISVLEDIQDKVKAFAAGGVDYVTRPFQEEEVLTRVETHLTLRAMQKQLEEKNRPT